MRVEGPWHPRLLAAAAAITAALIVPVSVASRQSAADVQRDWIDADTGHRVVRLTGDGGGSTLYFHDNAFSPRGDRMIVNTPNGLAVVEVAKIGTPAANLDVIA